MREFERLRDSDALLEWAEVHGNCYGTPREPAEAAMAQGRDMLFDIDWQGAKQLNEKMRADIVSIFILPPSMKELKSRLQAPRRGFGGDHRDAAAQCPHRDRALAGIRLRRHQRRSRPRLRAR